MVAKDIIAGYQDCDIQNFHWLAYVYEARRPVDREDI